MAGLIAGRGHGNGAGVLGIAPKAKILPIKVEQGKKYAGSPAIARGIETALDRGARIINVSLAAAPSDELDAAMGRASREGAVVVAGIGNTGANLRGGYPAVMREALAVGASGRNGERDGISVKDPAVALCAPGAQIPDLGLNHKYVLSRGTSNSTAIVSGAAALVWDKFPDLSAPEVMHRLTATADDNGPPGRDDQCGYGVLNIVKALTADVPPLPTSTPTSTPGTEPPTSAPAAQATPEPRSSNVPAIAGGALGTLLVGGLVTLLVTRRRRSAAPDR
jgi:subtilisin family serine protease